MNQIEKMIENGENEIRKHGPKLVKAKDAPQVRVRQTFLGVFISLDKAPGAKPAQGVRVVEPIPRGPGVSRSEKVLAALKQASVPITSGAVATRTRLDQIDAANVLVRLVERGMVKRSLLLPSRKAGRFNYYLYELVQ